MAPALGTGRSAFLLELILAYAAKRAGEILGNILPLCSGSDTAILIALSLVIDPAADCAYVFHILLISFPEASPLMHAGLTTFPAPCSAFICLVYNMPMIITIRNPEDPA